jgi:hypothetical protein
MKRRQRGPPGRPLDPAKPVAMSSHRGSGVSGGGGLAASPCGAACVLATAAIVWKLRAPLSSVSPWAGQGSGGAWRIVKRRVAARWRGGWSAGEVESR